MMTRNGYCTFPTGKGRFRHMSDCCSRKATTIVTDLSREREVCAQHAKQFAQFGPQRIIETIR